MKTKDKYIEYLNSKYTKSEALHLTEHCWAGSDKTKSQKQRARSLVNHGMLGQCLRTYDPIGFEVGYNEWKI